MFANERPRSGAAAFKRCAPAEAILAACFILAGCVGGGAGTQSLTSPPSVAPSPSPAPSSGPVLPTGEVKPTIAFSTFDRPADLSSLVLGPDGAPYVLDRATASVYRIDLAAKQAVAIFAAGQKAGGATSSIPRLLTTGGSDILVLDEANVLWRWRPADAKGKGTLTPVRVPEASTWDTDVVGIGTFLRDPDLALYNLYVIDPSESQVVRYAPAMDGSGYPASGTDYLTTPRDVATATSLYIDGELFLADGGALVRFHAGTETAGWPIDRSAARVRDYRLLASPDERGRGILYAYDAANEAVVAIGKTSGSDVAEYRIQSNVTADWHDVRGMYITEGASDKARHIWWIDAGRLLSADLGPTPVLPSGTGAAPAESSSPTATPPSGATDCVNASLDYGPDARGKPGEPVDLARSAISGLRAGDVLERADPADAGAVQVVRAGEIVGTVTYMSDGHGGWLLVGGAMCAGLGIKL